ncbi:MAG: energy transducer TonB [Cytophagaceae bacterium]
MGALNSSFDEIVFENRNKLFGAYTLRNRYERNILISMTVALTGFFLLVSLPKIIEVIKPEKVVAEKVHMVEVKLEDLEIPPIDPSTPPPPPPPKIEMPQLSTLKFLPPVVKPDQEVQEELPPTVEELAESNAGEKDQEGELMLSDIVVIDTKEEIIEEIEEEVFTWVAEMPVFKGGDEALIKFLGDRLRYPKEATKNIVEGDVWIEFIVNKDGSLTDFKVLRSLGHGCDEEALRVARLMPAWTPAYQNGKAVKLKKKMKITFKFPN